MTTVAVIGGGNIGTLMAAEMSRNGCHVRMYASDASNWGNSIDVYGPEGDLLFSAGLQLVTSQLNEAIRGAKWVIVTHPSSRFEMLAKDLIPLVEAGQRVVVVPGADAEYYFAEVVNRGAVLLGLQRVHSIARLRERGHSVYQLGKKPSVQLASIPSDAANQVSSELAEMMGMPVEVLPNYLVETLTPSNPILHTTRLATMFRDWHEGLSYPRNIPFYETWDEESSRCMIGCDCELQSLCRSIEERSELDLSGVVPLTTHYESPDARAMTDKISHIPAFKGLGSPMREVAPGEWVPDFSSRYFTADFEIGLKAIIDLADAFSVKVPHMRDVITWYERTSGAGALSRVVAGGPDEILSLYN